MYVRRNADGDRERALAMLDVSMQQFRETGITGWVSRADELRTGGPT